MKTLINRFVKDESGATAIEYGLIAGLLSIVIIAAVSLAGTSLTAVFGTISTKLNESIATTP
ncbi:pilus assembly protein Flp/PilA [Labrenzia sp. EL_126]|nr:pilus assembly protein Flp/PilA [Labrenzia sp. EL_126]